MGLMKFFMEQKKVNWHYLLITQVLEKYYLDPKVLTAVEISALKVRVFGKK